MRISRLHRNIQVRIATSALMKFGSTAVFPFMAIYLSLHLGQALAGAFLLVGVLGSVGGVLYGGHIADKVGRKKVLVGSQIAQLIAYGSMAVANSPWIDSLWLTVIMMMLQSVSSGLITPAADAMLIDACDSADRRLMYSINYWSQNLAMATGALVGGALFQQYRFALFVAISGISLLGLLLYAFCVVEMTQTRGEREGRAASLMGRMIADYTRVLSDRRFLWYACGSLMVMALQFQMTNYIGVRIARSLTSSTLAFGFASIRMDGYRILSWIQIENTIAVVVGAMFVARFTRERHDDWIIPRAMALYALGYGVLGMASDFWVVSIMVLVVTLAELMYVPVRQSVLANIARPDARGSYTAVNSLIYHGGKACGSGGLIVGAFVPAWAMSGLYVAVAMVAASCYRMVASIEPDATRSPERVLPASMHESRSRTRVS